MTLTKALLFAALSLGGCKADPSSAPSTASGAALCARAGGTLDAARNECVCAAGFVWNGAICATAAADASRGDAEIVPPANLPPALPTAHRAAEAAHGGAEAPAPPPSGASSPRIASASGDAEQEPEASSAAESEQALDSTQNQTADQASTATPANLLARLRADCAAAQGEWIGKDAYCYCPGGRVLVGRTCAAAPGDVTRGICEHVARPGQWRHDTCRCSDPTAVFSPGRGGCVPMRLLSEATQRRVCESAVNRGKWQTREARCVCPAGRLWTSERCTRQAELSSERVCESGYNQGRWDAARKSCSCPRGRLWIDQTCKDAARISPRLACAGEFNRGRWNEAVNSCDCPDDGVWDAYSKRCLPQ